MDGEDKDDASDEDYDPEQSNVEDSEDKEDNDSDGDDDDGDDAPETEMLDDEVDVGKQAERIPGVDQEIPGMDGTEEEIPGVDDAEGIPGMGDTIQGVDDEVGDEATPGVYDDAPDTTNESDKAEIEQTHIRHVQRNELVQTTNKRIQPQELRQRLQHHRRNPKQRRDHTHAAQIQKRLRHL